MRASKPSHWKEGYVLANSVQFHYIEQGQGPLVVLLHGFPEFSYSWRFQIPALADAGYRAVAPDLRGYNLTEKPLKGYDLETLSQDTVGLIDALGADKADLIAHDWGGLIGWHAATFHPEKIHRLVIMNCPHPNQFYKGIRSTGQLKKSWYVFFFQIPWVPEYVIRRDDYAFVAKSMRGSAVQKHAFDRETLDKYRNAMSQPDALSRSIQYYRCLFREAILGRRRPWPGKVTKPTLVVWGEQDIFLGKELNEGLSDWVEDLTLHYLPDSGHWVQQEKPEEVNQHILAFLGPGEGREHRIDRPNEEEKR